MQTIGERLEEARKRKGISVREAAETTKIRGDYLQKFEANSFDIDLPPLYIRGFIRTYARFLELDPERLVNDVDAALAREGKPPRREHREALGRVDFGAENRPAESADTGSTGRSTRDQAVMIKLGLLIGGGVLGLVVLVLLFNVLFSRTPAKQPAPVAPPTAADNANQGRAQVVTLTAIDNTRVKVTQVSDAAVLISDHNPMVRGETRTVRKTGKLTIVVEDRKKVRLEVDGRALEIPTLQHGDYGSFTLD